MRSLASGLPPITGQHIGDWCFDGPREQNLSNIAQDLSTYPLLGWSESAAGNIEACFFALRLHATGEGWIWPESNGRLGTTVGQHMAVRIRGTREQNFFTEKFFVEKNLAENFSLTIFLAKHFLPKKNPATNFSATIFSLNNFRRKRFRGTFFAGKLFAEFF